MRHLRGQFNINNIAEAADLMPMQVIEEVQDIIDNPPFDIPDQRVTGENAEHVAELTAYYANMQAFLTGLWGAMRVSTSRTEAQRMAVRDYLEKAVSVAGKKYDAASRQLTAYQFIQQQKTGTRTL